MAEPQLFFIATSKAVEIRKSAVVKFDWGNYGSWTNFKSPAKSSVKKVKYNKTTKNAPGSSKLGGNGGKTVLGSSIPATATRTINGVSRTCDVRYHQRGYTIYSRTSALKKKNQMLKYSYTSSKPYQYRLQYKDKAVATDATYSEYRDSKTFIYFSDSYQNDSGSMVETTGHIPHPTSFKVTYSDCRRNFSSSANNSDNRDNSGTYVISNVRANIVTLAITWEGLSADEGADLLSTLNPSKDSKGAYPYLTVQYRDPADGKIKNKTFVAGDRSVEPYPSGAYKSIEVTLTEV